MISFTVPGNPQSLKRHRTFRRGNFTGQYDPSKADKSDFLAMAMQHRPDVPLSCPLSVEINCCFPRPKGHYRTGKNAHLLKDGAPGWHTGRPDADNLGKFVCDALNGIFWMDDSCICLLTISKGYGPVPYTEVTITAAL